MDVEEGEKVEGRGKGEREGKLKQRWGGKKRGEMRKRKRTEREGEDNSGITLSKCTSYYKIQ